MEFESGMNLEHIRVRDELGDDRVLSAVEEYIVQYLLRYARKQPVIDYLHRQDYLFYKSMGEKPVNDTDQLYVALRDLEEGYHIIDWDWLDDFFAYVMKINRFHTTYDY